MISLEEALEILEPIVPNIRDSFEAWETAKVFRFIGLDEQRRVIIGVPPIEVDKKTGEVRYGANPDDMKNFAEKPEEAKEIFDF